MHSAAHLNRNRPAGATTLAAKGLTLAAQPESTVRRCRGSYAQGLPTGSKVESFSFAFYNLQL